MIKLFKNRFSVLVSFISFYLILSTSIRIILYFLSFKNIDFSFLSLIKIFSLGFFFDFGVALFFTLIYSCYLICLPSKFIGNLFDKIVTYTLLGLILFISIFAFISEFPFWDEFNTRFNFIAVDYLIYTYEVIENINQSYPIPLILLSIFTFIFGILFTFKKKKVFYYTFTEKTKLNKRILYILPLLAVSTLYILFVNNHQAEWSSNLYENELSKNGVYSFFAAYRSNELDYKTFYAQLPEKLAYEVLKKELIQNNQHEVNNNYDNIKRNVIGDSSQNPNIILVTIESFSADFLKYFGNEKNLTPHFERLAENSIFLTNMYATGTRTIRGMEALTLCIPPTPGNSIVRRPNNDHIFSIATILKKKNYALDFIYGGDGYFDNMNTFFGGQGFDIIDRDRGNPLSDNIKTNRYPMPDNEVTFENAWGTCDEDIYNQSIKRADLQFIENKPFFHFIMTTSNHKPYSFPNGKISSAQGSRESAVKYTDFALNQFIEQSKNKPWFANTIFVIVADHCASSAGKWEINIEKHHIPAIIFNSKYPPQKINKLISQIDLMPTVFGLLHWSYQTELYGKDITLMTQNEERSLIGNYRTLGLLKNNVFTEINDHKKVIQYHWDAQLKLLSEMKSTQIDSLKNLTISYYQTTSERFKNGKMKQQ